METSCFFFHTIFLKKTWDWIKDGRHLYIKQLIWSCALKQTWLHNFFICHAFLCRCFFDFSHLVEGHNNIISCFIFRCFYICTSLKVLMNISHLYSIFNVHPKNRGLYSLILQIPFYLFSTVVVTAVTELGNGKPKFYSTPDLIAFCRNWRLPTNHVWLFSTRWALIYDLSSRVKTIFGWYVELYFDIVL